MAPVSSEMHLALVLSRGSRLGISGGRYNIKPGELHRYGKPPNRSLWLRAQSQRYLSYTSQWSKGMKNSNHWWKSWLREKPKDSSLMECDYPSQRLPQDPYVIDALMTRELRRLGDFREPDDLSDFEFNHIYLDVIDRAPCYMEHTAPKMPSPASFIEQRIEPQFLQPQSFDPQSSTWAPFGNGIGTLKRGQMLKIASWNMFYPSPGPKARASAALAQLRTMFGEEPHDLVVMFQELNQQSLYAILDDEWVRQNFVLSDRKPPDRFYGDDESLDWEKTGWQSSEYFTLMMVSRTLPISNCFRMPFVSQMGRDALVVDIPISENERMKESLRLCTTHLESLYTGKEYRSRQLAVISGLLKGELSQGQRICAGLVGGDMNSVHPFEHEIQRAPEVGLKDVWEDEPAPTPPILKPFQKDVTYGRARGNTWGYQTHTCKTRGRLDKFLYTGPIETFAVKEAQDVVGKLGRFGIGLKTKVGSDDVWVSDHFGIAVGIRVI